MKELVPLPRRDVCHFQQHCSRCIMWMSPENTDPVILHALTRKSIAAFVAVCITDGRFTYQTTDTSGGQSFLKFLKGLITRR